MMVCRDCPRPGARAPPAAGRAPAPGPDGSPRSQPATPASSPRTRRPSRGPCCGLRSARRGARRAGARPSVRFRVPPARGRGPDCVSSRSTGWGPDMRKKSDTYVLHVFQKKAKHGIATSKRDLNLIRTRLEQATRLHAENEGALPMGTTRRRIKVTEGSGNIFADVGIERPEEYLAKAELARQIVGALDARRVTQTEAARILGVNQPKVSALRNG